MSTTIAIVEPHLLVRAGFTLILDATNDLTVVGQAETLEEMVPLLAEHQPDIVCVAAKFDDGSTIVDGLQRISQIEGARPVVVLLTGKRDADVVEVATSRGVAAVISKYSAPEDIVEAVRGVRIAS